MNPAEYEIMYRVETDHWWYKNLHQLVENAFDQVPTRDGLVLDAGCGTGAVVARLAQRYSVIGLDYSPLALSFTRSRVPVPLVRGSIASLPFPDNTFTAVVSLDVVSHAAAGPPEGSLAELARAIRPGGHLIVNLPAYAWLRSPHDEQVQTGYRFTRSELTRLLRGAGLELVRCTYWNTLLMPAVVAARVLKRIARSTTSDLAEYRPGAGAAVCSAVLSVERRVLRLAPLPFGVSLFAVARKPE